MYRLTTTVLCIALAVSCVCAKTGRTYYDADMMSEVREKLEKYDWAQTSLASTLATCERWIAMSDEELWQFVPPPEQLRALNVSFGVGCPDCGTEIFRRGGHYPWIMDSEHPFKVKCPVCGKMFPENDFEPWNLDSLTEEPQKGLPIQDFGAGWQDENGKRYFFVGTYVFWHRWQKEVFPAISALAQAYLLTDKPIYAQKCTVLLSSLAEKWKKYDYPSQAYHNGQWPAHINGRVLDYIWTTGTIGSMATAYDAIYPSLDANPELLDFLSTKGIDEPRQYIEQEMLGVMADDIMRGFIVGNMGMHQRALALTAIVLDNDDPDYAPTTAQMRDWIMTGPGTTEYLLWNGFFRDGHGGESSPGYSAGWCDNFYTVATLLPKLGVNIWDSPKVKKMADIGLDMAITGVFTPCIGDSGTIFGSKRIGWNAQRLGSAFTHYGDPRYAKALSIIGASSETLFDDLFDAAAVKRIVDTQGTEMEYKTRNLGGYGLAILEAGEGDNKRGVSMYYGFAGGGHGHRDRLTMEMIAYDRPMLTDMGYPAHWLAKNNYWTSNTISHYDVLVDQAWQTSMNRGYLNTLAGSPHVQLMDASAEDVTYPGIASLYRRTAALVDISPETSYLLDIFRVEGGYQHDYSFHGPPFPEFTVDGATPGPLQEKGTLAGKDVEFGGTPPRVADLAEGSYALPLREGQGMISDGRSYGEASLDGWAAYLSGDTVLTRKLGASLTLPINEMPAGKIKILIQYHDYNTGRNTLDVTIGGTITPITLGNTGTDTAWASAIIDLPQPATSITLTARQMEQPYIYLDTVVLTRDLGAARPMIADIRTSGFQYLFNIRRMNPKDQWSATWRQPDEDVSLTMTMPAGTVQEAILADAEAELLPNHPPTLQYVLGRNSLTKEQREAGETLSSAYITVSEPHKGAAAVKSVEKLASFEASKHAVGLSVTHGNMTDLIHSTLDQEADQECIWQTADDSLMVTGEFAAVTLDTVGVKRMCLVNGTALSFGEIDLTVDPLPLGHVIAVDYDANAITVEGEVPFPDALIDRVAILGNELQRTSYTIKSCTVEGGNTTFGFGDTLFIIQMGYVEAIDNTADTLTLAKLDRVDGKRHQGRWLYNEDRSIGLRISNCTGSTFTVENAPQNLDAAFSDIDGDGRRLFWISDIGPGDNCHVPTITSVEREADNLYRVQSMSNVTLSVPGAKVALVTD